MTHPLTQAREALQRIERWFGEFPDSGRKWDDGRPMSYGAAFGSNGERDYMRGVAREALAALSAPQGEPQAVPADLLEAVDTLLSEALCECPDKMKHEDGRHFSWCHLSDLNDARVRMLTAAPAAPKPAEAQWMPIETAPRDGTLILLRESYEEEPFIGRWYGFLSRWCASTTHYDTDGNACVVDRVYSEGVTHWMPIPPAPAAPQE